LERTEARVVDGGQAQAHEHVDEELYQEHIRLRYIQIDLEWGAVDSLASPNTSEFKHEPACCFICTKTSALRILSTAW
jgi:hypothetical protein